MAKKVKGADEIFCPSCGEIIKTEAEICPKCGVRQKQVVAKKDKLTAGLLAIFLGGFGVHKFYLNRVGLGILYLVFCWTFIPAIVGFIEGILYLISTDDEFQKYYSK
ncbi:MAG: TM2 domain-containing protein [Candidatus ainarchaeum sp.]|nr:TM2 domain-containing protein [Candidatus ainarchaeum sp.]